MYQEEVLEASPQFEEKEVEGGSHEEKVGGPQSD